MGHSASLLLEMACAAVANRSMQGTAPPPVHLSWSVFFGLSWLSSNGQFLPPIWVLLQAQDCQPPSTRPLPKSSSRGGVAAGCRVLIKLASTWKRPLWPALAAQFLWASERH